MATKPCGWIVTAQKLHQTLEGSVNGPAAGVLMTAGSDATLFPNYDGARNAVRRTCRYARRKGYVHWPTADEYRIHRVWLPEVIL